MSTEQSRRQQLQREEERLAVECLIEHLQWRGARNLEGSDPPDRIIVKGDGRVLGCEVTLWIRSGQMDIESLDEGICQAAYRDFIHPDGFIVTMGLFPNTGDDYIETMERREVRRLAIQLRCLVEDMLAEGKVGEYLPVPDGSDLPRLYTEIKVAQFPIGPARLLYEERNAGLREPQQKSFEEVVRDQWGVRVGRPVFANVPASSSADAKSLQVLISKKSGQLPRWSTPCDERWLVVSVNNPDGGRLANLWWLQDAEAELGALIPPHAFDVIAFVPVVEFDRFHPHIFKFGNPLD